MFRQLHPAKAYVTEDVMDDSRAAARVERMASAFPDTPCETVSYDDLDAIAAERWQGIPRWGEIATPTDPDIVLTTGKFWPDEDKAAFRDRYPNLRVRDLWGFQTVMWRPDGELDWRRKHRGCICQSAWQLHTIMGCPFRCAYCGFGGVNRILVNLEEYLEHLDEICTRKPNQRLFKWDNQSDVSCFEPEYGASKLLVEHFARKPGRYLEIYTGKSDNIDDLLELDHRGKTIIQWSVAGDTQCTRFEPETARWRDRIRAAKRCQEAGYIVRYRFSPIIPVQGWEDENAALIDEIFARTSPDVISLCPLGWMPVDAVRRVLDFSLLDPAFVAAMEAAAPFLAARGFTSGGGHPIPHDARAYMLKVLIDRIRSHSRTIPISLCLETVEMWALFGRELGMPVDPERTATYYCNCGPLCTPESAYSKGVEPGESWFPSHPRT